MKTQAKLRAAGLNAIQHATCRALVALVIASPLCSQTAAQANSIIYQAEMDLRTLAPGRATQREIAGGQAQTYQIRLTAGQFMSVVVEQKGIDVALALAGPDGNQLVENDLTNVIGGREPLSYVAATDGQYQLTVRAVNKTALAGIYLAGLEVRASASALDRQRIEAEGLTNEARRLIRQGSASAPQAVEKLKTALALWRAVGDRYWEAYTLHALGVGHFGLRQRERAREYFELRQRERAREYFEQALQIRREVKDRAGEGATLHNLGLAAFDLNRYEQAIAYHEQAASVFRDVKNRSGEGINLHNAGWAYHRLSRNEEAVKQLEQALSIHREVKDRVLEGISLDLLGQVYIWLGRYEKAIEHFEQALQISREVKNRGGEAVALHNLGWASSFLSQHEKAVEFYEQALVIRRETKNRAGEGITLNNLGSGYSTLGRPEKAIELYEQALSIAREVKDRYREGIALYSLGGGHYSLGRTEKAIVYWEQALQLRRELKDRAGEGIALEALGHTYVHQGQLEKATEYLEHALRIAREIKGRGWEASALATLMEAQRARNQSRLAIFFGKQSVNLYQAIRGDIRSLDEESRQSFLKSKEVIYRMLADLLISQGRLPEAEQVINLLKEEEYFDFIRRDQSKAPQAGKAQLTPEEQALEKRYHEIADRLAELGTERGSLVNKQNRTPEEEQRLARIDADLTVAGGAFQKFLSKLEAELGSSRDVGARVYTLRESQGLMEDLRELGMGTVALYTLIGEDKYRVILTTPDFQKGYEYAIKSADLNRKVLQFRQALQNPKLDPLPLAQELYRILVGLVAKDLERARATTLMWSLDGVLRYLPVAALHDGKGYMVERYRNVVFTPASQSRLKDAPSNHWRALGLGVTKSHGDRIPALPGVAEEMHGIIRDESSGASGGILPGTIKLDEAFTQESMLAGLRQRPPVVHIASHFQFQPGNETNSALLLGDGKYLSLAQIKSLPNVFGGVELLTLSACNTATGGGANGKEVEGFGVLAQRQGAKAVVASLWPVADRSTKLLMQEFYRIREAKKGAPKVEALRQAQLKLLSGEVTAGPLVQQSRQVVHERAKPGANAQPTFKVDPKAPFAHPYYWAPFILIGNWR